MAAGERLERQVPGGGERRLGGRDQLWRNGRRVARRICHGVDRYWTRRWARYICPRSPRKADRFRVALRTRDDSTGESADSRVLRRCAEALVLERLLDRRTPGPQRSTDVSGRLRRDHRRSPGESAGGFLGDPLPRGG